MTLPLAVWVRWTSPERTFELTWSAADGSSFASLAVGESMSVRKGSAIRTAHETVRVTDPASTHWSAYCPRCVDLEAVRRHDDGAKVVIGQLAMAGDRQGAPVRPTIVGHPHGIRHPDGWPWYGQAKPRKWSSASRWWEPDSEPSADRRRFYYRPIRLPAVIDCTSCAKPVLVQRIGASIDVHDYTAIRLSE